MAILSDPLFFSFHLLTKSSPNYPKGWNDLPDAPGVLYVLGDSSIFSQPSISIVGTRHSFEDSNQVAFSFSQTVAKEDILVVSGLASGIDTQAHEGAIITGKTVAILAFGFYYLPKKQYPLLRRILASGGAILSEYPPDTPPRAFTFLKRNRLIATFSQATVVIQAPEKSGALHTAHLAQQYHRPVYVVPWNIQTFRAVGSNALLLQGAIPLLDCQPLLALAKLPSIASSFPKEQDKLSKIPSSFRPLYQYILQNEPVSLEQIDQAFPQEAIATLHSRLLFMELQSYLVKEGTFYQTKINFPANRHNL